MRRFPAGFGLPLTRAARSGVAQAAAHAVQEGDTHAERDGYERALIDHPAHLVRISTMRHWRVTGWYQTPREDLGGQTPRAYLRGKSWDVRYEFGLRPW